MANSPIQRLGNELERHATSAGLSQAEHASFRNRLARHVLSALNDDEHPFTQQVAALRRFVGDLAETSASGPQRSRPSEGGRPHHVLFMPQPGSSDPLRRSFWPTQLLLAETAQAKTHYARTLADRLVLGPDVLKSAVQQAAQHSWLRWSSLDHLHYLVQALKQLDAPPAQVIEIDGRELSQGGHTVRLSPQEARFLELLDDAAGSPVSHEALQKAGVTKPVKIKHNLMSKLDEAGIRLPLHVPRRGYYQLDT